MAKFQMPAEWEKHKATWLAWPHDKITFSKNFDKVEKTFIEIIKALHTDEEINLIVLDEIMKANVLKLAHESGIDITKIKFYVVEYADTWTRDYAPIFVNETDEGGITCVKWEYNAYGNKFPDLLKDNNVFNLLGGVLGFGFVKPGIVMEGGSIELNGKGTLITTKQCLLNPNRNPSLNQKEIEEKLSKYTGATNFIWLNDGIINDHTDGHIDDLVKFVAENTIVCAFEEDQNDPNFKILNDNFNTLESAQNEKGEKFKLVKIPIPHFNYDDGERAPASYANFYIGNRVVLVPIYNDPNDQKALEIISSLFPTRKTIGIDCSDIIYGGGAIHCITQQQPSF